MRSMVMLTALAAWVLVAIGCVGYAPGVSAPEGAERGRGWVANPALDDVAVVSLRHVLVRQPARGAYAVSFPEWMSETRARRIVLALEDENAHILTPETEHWPVYHVAWVRVMGDSATAHVHRPMMQGLTQAYDVRSRGGLRPWRVTSVRAWGMGALPEPERHLLGVEPEPDADDAGAEDNAGA
ncbi:MAG: hypothetical protein EA379_07795 [Phycisphaerales bacterium]|nr:MAG: hypothetical protein EA379_07795 [Phycisphaerales bacterium]